MLRLPKVCVDLFALSLFAVLSGPAQDNEVRGKVEGLFPDKHQIVLADAAGKSRTIDLVENCKVVINDRNSPLSDLQVGDRVTVVLRTEGEKARAVEIRCKRE